MSLIRSKQCRCYDCSKDVKGYRVISHTTYKCHQDNDDQKESLKSSEGTCLTFFFLQTILT